MSQDSDLMLYINTVSLLNLKRCSKKSFGTNPEQPIKNYLAFIHHVIKLIDGPILQQSRIPRIGHRYIAKQKMSTTTRKLNQIKISIKLRLNNFILKS